EETAATATTVLVMPEETAARRASAAVAVTGVAARATACVHRRAAVTAVVVPEPNGVAGPGHGHHQYHPVHRDAPLRCAGDPFASEPATVSLTGNPVSGSDADGDPQSQEM